MVRLSQTIVDYLEKHECFYELGEDGNFRGRDYEVILRADKEETGETWKLVDYSPGLFQRILNYVRIGEMQGFLIYGERQDEVEENFNAQKKGLVPQTSFNCIRNKLEEDGFNTEAPMTNFDAYLVKKSSEEQEEEV